VSFGLGGILPYRELALRLMMAGSNPWYSIRTIELPGTDCMMFIQTWKMVGVIF
jgi:hypothetical protein